MGRPSKGVRLEPRENGFFYIVWSGSRRGRSTGTKDRALAEIALASFIMERDRMDARSGKSKLDVATCLEIYLDEHIRPRKKLAGRVVQSVQTAEDAASFLKLHFGNKLVSDIVPDDITHPETGYIIRRMTGQLRLSERSRGTHVKPWTVRRDLGVFVSALKWCATVKDATTGMRRLPKDDVPVIPLPPASPRKDRWLTLEEERQLLAAAPPAPEGERLSRIHRFLTLALEDGARCEAIEELTWFQVDFRAGMVDYRKPGADAQHNKQRAKVRMTSRSRAMLERAHKERTGPFVMDHAGSIRSPFEAAVARARLEAVSPHVLRHTWATRASQNGVSMEEIATQLADDLRTVINHYWHHHPDSLKAAATWRDKEAAEYPTNSGPNVSVNQTVRRE